MRPIWTAVVLVAARAGALASDPSIAQLKSRFTKEEGVLLQALLHQEQNARAFVEEGKTMAAADFTAAWRIRLADWGSDYLSKPHGMNLKARTLREVGEPAEWAMLMESMRVNAGQWKTEYFRDQMLKAEDELRRGDTKRTQWVVKTAREFLVENLREFLGSDAAKQALARRGQLAAAQQEAERRRREAQDAERRREARDAERRETQESARRQAEEARRNTEQARQAPTPERAAEQTGPAFDGGAPRPADAVVAASPVVETPQERQAAVAPSPAAGSGVPVASAGPLSGPVSGLTGPRQGQPGQSRLGASVPSPAGSDPDMDELRAGRKGAASTVFGHSNLISAGIGAVIGALVSLVLGGPILLAAAIGAAVGFGASYLLS